MTRTLRRLVTDRRIGVAGIIAAVPALTTLETALRPQVLEQLTMGVATLLALAATSVIHRRSREQAELERRDRLLARALADWPPRTVGDSNPFRLGIFPGRGEGCLPIYVPRVIDRDLEGALADERIVIVFGPPGAGKSRAAWEAAKRVRPDSKIVAPTGPDGLRALLEADAFDMLDGPRIVWLEQLDEYLEALSASVLDGLLSNARTTVVATVEEAAWEQALADSGPRGTAARFLVSHARGVRVPARFGLLEAGKAAHRLGWRRVDRCFALRWREGHPAGTAPAPPAQRTPRRPAVRGALPALLIAGTLAALGATGVEFKMRHVSLLHSPPTYAEQLSRERSDYAAGRDPVSLHDMSMGEGEPVKPVIYEDPRGRRSDELVLFERSGDGPAKPLHFEPSPVGGVPWRFKVVGRVSLAADGSQQLLGEWTPAGRQDGAVPVMVFFDPKRSRYWMSGLLRRPPLPRRFAVSRRQRRLYDRRQVLTQPGGFAVSGYAVGAATVASVRNRERLVATFYRRSPARTGRARAWIESWLLGGGGRLDRPLRCPAPVRRSAVAAFLAGAPAGELAAAARDLPECGDG